MKYVFPALGGYLIGLLVAQWLNVNLTDDQAQWMIVSALMCFGFGALIAKIDKA